MTTLPKPLTPWRERHKVRDAIREAIKQAGLPEPNDVTLNVDGYLCISWYTDDDMPLECELRAILETFLPKADEVLVSADDPGSAYAFWESPLHEWRPVSVVPPNYRPVAISLGCEDMHYDHHVAIHGPIEDLKACIQDFTDLVGPEEEEKLDAAVGLYWRAFLVYANKEIDLLPYEVPQVSGWAHPEEG